VLLLSFGLIFRGVAFEYRNRGTRRLWDTAFFLGSTVAAFVQGTAVGAMIAIYTIGVYWVFRGKLRRA
jgi:cytochrome bd ubiquinol oxidase subunit II